MEKAIAEVGHQYGHLIVLERRGSNARGRAMWLCECSCGNLVIIRGTSLRLGNTKSCGCQQAHALPRGEAAFNRLLTRMKNDAKRRKYDWQLTREQVWTLTQKPCYYCGTKPAQISRKVGINNSYIYNGLDRVDNDRSYIIDNVVPCCGTCNKAKQTMTTEEFKTWVRNIYEHFGKV